MDLFFFKMRANEGGLLGVEDFPAGQAVSDEFVFVECPDDFSVFIEFDDLRILVAGVAVADDKVAIWKLLKVGGPSKFDIGAGDFLFYFPNNFFIRRDFED